MWNILARFIGLIVSDFTWSISWIVMNLLAGGMEPSIQAQGGIASNTIELLK